MISTAIQRGNNVYVYNEKNTTLMIKSGQLLGYTGSSVSVKYGNTVYTYDETGRTISIH